MYPFSFVATFLCASSFWLDSLLPCASLLQGCLVLGKGTKVLEEHECKVSWPSSTFVTGVSLPSLLHSPPSFLPSFFFLSCFSHIPYWLFLLFVLCTVEICVHCLWRHRAALASRRSIARCFYTAGAPLRQRSGRVFCATVSSRCVATTPVRYHVLLEDTLGATAKKRQAAGCGRGA